MLTGPVSLDNLRSASAKKSLLRFIRRIKVLFSGTKYVPWCWIVDISVQQHTHLILFVETSCTQNHEDHCCFPIGELILFSVSAFILRTKPFKPSLNVRAM